MTTKRKLAIILASVLALAIVVGGVLGAVALSNRNIYNKNIAMGNKYLATGDYESAIQSFQKALSAAPDREEAYDGLIRVYSATGDMDLARSVLEQAQSRGMTLSLDVNIGDAQPTKTIASNDADARLNTDLLNLISGSTYNDYRIRNGIENSSENGDSVTVRASGLAGELIFRNTSSNDSAVLKGRVSTSAIPAEVRLDHVSVLLGKDELTFDELKQLNLKDLKVEDGVVVFTASNCRISISCDHDGNVTKDAVCLITPLKSTEQQDQTFKSTVSGGVVDAVTGNKLSNVTMIIRPVGQRTGDGLETVTSDTYGSYTVKLEGGQYTVELQHEGYTTEYVDMYVGTYQDQMTQNFTISPELQAGEIRIVLEWGSHPSDLDSYLRGSRGNDNVFINYQNPVCSVGGEKLAELDVDDIDGYGPETTTIYDPNGDYTFSVEDFTDSGDLAISGATVKVYLPGQAPVTISISDCVNTATDRYEIDWTVFRVNNGELEIINQIQNMN